MAYFPQSEAFLLRFRTWEQERAFRFTRDTLSDFGLVGAGTPTWFGTRDLGFRCNGKRALAPATEKSEYWEKGTPDTRHLRGRGTKALHLLIQHEAEEIKVGRSLKSERPTSFLRPGFEPPPIGGIRIRER